MGIVSPSAEHSMELTSGERLLMVDIQDACPTTIQRVSIFMFKLQSFNIGIRDKHLLSLQARGRHLFKHYVKDGKPSFNCDSHLNFWVSL